MLRQRVSALLAVAGCVAASAAWPQSSLMKQARTLFEPIPEAPPSLPENPVTPEKVDLG